MSVYVDLECAGCGAVLEDQWSDRIGEFHTCGGMWERVFTLTKAPAPGTHTLDKVVVYESAQEGGHIQYPGRNDDPVPARLQARGYVRKELNVRDLASFEKRHGVMNERRHYDRNGKTD